MERPMFTLPTERPKSEAEIDVEQLERLEQDALKRWADIIDVAKKNEIDLENLLDPREEDPAYKDLKQRLLILKDETLKILFELDNKKEKYRREGLIVET